MLSKKLDLKVLMRGKDAIIIGGGEGKVIRGKREGGWRGRGS